MRQGIFGQIGHDTTGLLDNVVGRGTALGHSGIGQVGDCQQNIGNLFFGRHHRLFERFGRLLDGSRLGFHGLGFLFFAGFHELSGLGGQPLQLGQFSVEFGLRSTTYLIQFEYTGYSLSPVEMLDSQPANHIFGILFNDT